MSANQPYAARPGRGLTTTRARTWWRSIHALALLVGLLHPAVTFAVTNVFFEASQTTNLVTSGTTSDTISSEEYLFTFTRDKLFTGGVGLTNPIGRPVRVWWPDGLEAQAITAGPNPGNAGIDIRRQDGQLFAIRSLTFKLLGNTFGAGASLEVMPKLNGEDGVPEPFMYNATGFYGQQFTNSTPELSGFDEYKITLYVDYALMRLTTVDASPPRPALQIVSLTAAWLEILWPTNAAGYVLESATNLPAQAWSAVTNDIAVEGEFYRVQLNATEPRRFIRLRK
jgi:hypothetical protein